MHLSPVEYLQSLHSSVGYQPLRNLLGSDWTKEHWYASRTERESALEQMSGRYLYFRPGDSPSLEFERLDP